jgi:hypothetical protein
VKGCRRILEEFDLPPSPRFVGDKRLSGIGGRINLGSSRRNHSHVRAENPDVSEPAARADDRNEGCGRMIGEDGREMALDGGAASAMLPSKPIMIPSSEKHEAMDLALRSFHPCRRRR